MANLTSHSLSFTKQDIKQLWIALAFLGDDIQNQMEVLTNVKGTQTLNLISRPSNITRATAVGFTAAGTISLTNTTITVDALKAQVEQNGEAFIASIYESLLASGYNLDDVQKMSNNMFTKIIIPLVADAIKQDKVRQMWFADTKKESMTGTIPASNPTGTLDVNNAFTNYKGLWTNFLDDYSSGTIASGQRVDITNANAADGVARVWKVTLSGTSGGTITLTINGTAYSQAYASSVVATVTAWHTAHAATIAARHSYEQKLTVADDGSAALTFTATHAGASFSAAATSAGTGGTWTVNTNTAATRQGNLASGAATSIFDSMIDAIPEEALDYEEQMKFYVTRTMWRNYVTEMKSLSSSDTAYMTVINGVKVKMYEGHEVVVRPDFDANIKALHNDVYRHRAILTVPKNMVFACDGALDDKAVESWYDQDEEMHRFRVKYRANTKYKYSKMVVIAF